MDINKKGNEMKNIDELAKDYAEYSKRTTHLSSFGKGCEDITPKGKKGFITRKYNLFADEADRLGVSLIGRNEILRKYIY